MMIKSMKVKKVAHTYGSVASFQSSIQSIENIFSPNSISSDWNEQILKGHAVV